MNYLDKVLILAALFIWVAVLIEYEAVPVGLYRGRGGGGGGRGGGGRAGGSRGGGGRISSAFRGGVFRGSRSISLTRTRSTYGSGRYGGRYVVFGFWRGHGYSAHRQNRTRLSNGSVRVLMYDKVKASAAGVLLTDLAKKISTYKSYSYDSFGIIVNISYDFYPDKQKKFEHDASAGVFNGYSYRPSRFKDLNGSVCLNNVTYAGIVFNEFKCPIDGFDADSTYCCGPVGQQFCCTKKDFQDQETTVEDDFDQEEKVTLTSKILTAILIIGVIGGCLALPVIFYFRVLRQGCNNKEEKSTDDTENDEIKFDEPKEKENEASEDAKLTQS